MERGYDEESMKRREYEMQKRTDELRQKKGWLLKIIAGSISAVFVILTFLVWYMGSENPVTQAGYVGYLTRGAVFGKAKYVGLQTGPTSYGRSWMMGVTNVSITPTKITEDFGNGSEALSKDSLKVKFAVHVMFRVRSTQVSELVEKYSTLQEKGDLTEVAFGNYIREPLRTEARQAVESLNAMEIGPNLTIISERLTAWATKFTAGTPFEVMTIVAGNFQYPKVVTDAVENKLAKAQEIEAAQNEVEIEKRKAERRVVEAEGIAKATSIIQARLTPLYIQHEAIEAQKAMVNSPNHTTIYIPVGNMGVPLIGNVSQKQEDKAK
jgi:regulator of protease activity HflC (stomatin/prohibitin superfamily)